MRSRAPSDTFGLRLLFRPQVQRMFLGAVLAVFLAIRAFQVLNFSTQDDWGFDLSFYWTAAHHVLDGESVYAPFQLTGPYPPQGVDYEYLYPPFLAVVLAPLAAVIPDYETANWLWAAAGAVILAFVVVSIAAREAIGSRADRVLLVGAAFVLGPVVSELILGNVHILILGLLASAWLALGPGSSRGDVAAGALIGVAALVKVFPGLLVLWLVLTRRYRAAIAAVVTMGLLVLATLPVIGIEPWLQYPTVLANLGPPTDLTFVLAPSAWLSGVLPARVAQVVVVVAGVGLLVWTTRRGSTAVGYAIAVVLCVLIAPALYPHYLVIMVLPLGIAMRHTPTPGWIALAYVLMLGMEIDVFGDASQLINRVMLSIGPLVLLGNLTWFGRERARHATAMAA